MPSSLITIRVTPRATHDAVGPLCDGVVAVRVTAPPADGRANAAACRLLAKRLGLAPSRVTLARGERSRVKTVRVEGLSAEAVGRALAAEPER